MTNESLLLEYNVKERLCSSFFLLRGGSRIAADDDEEILIQGLVRSNPCRIFFKPPQEPG